MKTKIILLLIILSGILLITCKDDEEPVCPELLIERIFPYVSPPDGPVLIKGTGFNEESITVRFGTIQATIVAKDKYYISTKVPTGLLGVVELSVTNSGCTIISEFEVSNGSLSSPGNPPVYLIPPSGFSFPVQLPFNATMYLTNIFDSSHSIKIYPFPEMGMIDESSGSYEGWSGEISPISGSIDLSKNEILIKVDRSGSDEELFGGFYTLSLRVDGQDRIDNFFIAFSTVTGKQYIFHR